jgi:hypothetical protein
MLAYESLKGTHLHNLTWLIEQAAAKNMTHALMIGQAHMMTQGRYLTTLWGRVTDNQKRALASLTGHLYQDRWGCLIKPYADAKTYADFANVAIKIMVTLQKTIARYAHKFLSGGRLSLVSVDSLSKVIIEATTAAQEQEAALETLISQYYPGISVHVTDSGAYIYADPMKTIDTETLSLHDVTPGATALIYTMESGIPQASEALAAVRRGWPLSARKLPHNAVEMNRGTLQGMLMKKMTQDPAVAAFSAILDELSALGEQVSLEPFGTSPDRIKLLSRKRSIPATLLEQIKLIDDTFVPLAADEIPETGIKEDLNRFLYKPPKRVLEMTVAPAAPPAAPGPAPPQPPQSDHEEESGLSEGEEVAEEEAEAGDISE